MMNICRSSRNLSRLSTTQWRSITTNKVRTFAENDLVLLRQAKDRIASPILTRPLRPNGRTETSRGPVEHANIIGKSFRESVKSTLIRSPGNGREFRLHPVTLDDYVLLSKRIVTPIYPPDANLIVSLLDLHPDPPQPGAEDHTPKLEILEAGTGHGALTLFLSRAVHAANPPFPTIAQEGSSKSHHVISTESAGDDEASSETSDKSAFAMWKSQRKAIIHTIELSPKHAAHARKVVHGFRHGMYARNVDFHIGDASAWLAREQASRTRAPRTSQTSQTSQTSSEAQTSSLEPGVAHDANDGNLTHPADSEVRNGAFLSHAILDMPGADLHFAAVASALHTDGTLVVFNPSITQLAECERRVRAEGIPLVLDKVIELGANGGSGGREWDLRFVVPRSKGEVKTELESEGSSSEEVSSGVDGRVGDAEGAAEEGNIVTETRRGEETARDAEKWVTVCRPKVGDRIRGGGFLGVWKRRYDVKST